MGGLWVIMGLRARRSKGLVSMLRSLDGGRRVESLWDIALLVLRICSCFSL